MKKTLSLVLCIMMLLSCIISTNSFASASEVIFATEFDSLDGFTFTEGSGWSRLKEIADTGDAVHKNALRVYQTPSSATGELLQTYTLDNAVSSGKLHISYQLKVTGTASQYQLIDVTDNAGASYASFARLSGAASDSYLENNWGSKAPNPTYTQNEWTQIDIVVDFANNKSYLYSNGVLKYTQNGLRMTSIKSITFKHYCYNTNGVEVFMDDLKISTCETDIYATDGIYDNGDIYFKLSSTIAESTAFPSSLTLKKVGSDETVNAAAQLVTNKIIKLTPETALDSNSEYTVVFPESAAYADILGNNLTASAKGFYVSVPAAEVTANVSENIPTFENASSEYLANNTGWTLAAGWSTSALVQAHTEGNYGVKLSGSTAPAVLYELSNVPTSGQYTMNLSYDAMIAGDAITGATLDMYLVQNDGQSNWSSNARSRLMTMNVADSGAISYWTGSSPYVSSATENKLYESVAANTWYTFEYSMLLGAGSGNKVSYTVKDSTGAVIASASDKVLMNSSFATPWRIAFTSIANTTVWFDNFSVDYSYTYTPASVESVRFIGLDNSEIVPDESVSDSFKGFKAQFSEAVEATATLVGASEGSIALTQTTSGAAAAHSWNLSGFLAPDTYIFEITYGENDSKVSRTFTTEEADSLAISDFGVYDGTTKVLEWNEALIGKSLTAKAKLVNPTGGTEKACIIYAAYNDGRMIAVNCNNVLGEEISGAFEGQTVQVPFTVPTGCDTIKAFLWTGLDTMMPLTSSEILID